MRAMSFTTASLSAGTFNQ